MQHRWHTNFCVRGPNCLWSTSKPSFLPSLTPRHVHSSGRPTEMDSCVDMSCHPLHPRCRLFMQGRNERLLPPPPDVTLQWWRTARRASLSPLHSSRLVLSDVFVLMRWNRSGVATETSISMSTAAVGAAHALELWKHSESSAPCVLSC